MKEAVVPEMDAKAVRITATRVANDLECPVIIVAGTEATPRQGTHHVLIAEDGNLEVCLMTLLATAGHEALKEHEKDMLTAERLRRLYAACTWAKSHLVVSMYTDSEKGESSHAAQPRKAHVAGTPALPFVSVDSIRRHADAVPEERSWTDVLANWTAVSSHWAETSRLEGSRSVTRVVHPTPPAPANENGAAVPSPSPIEAPADNDAAPAARSSSSSRSAAHRRLHGKRSPQGIPMTGHDPLRSGRRLIKPLRRAGQTPVTRRSRTGHRQSTRGGQFRHD